MGIWGYDLGNPLVVEQVDIASLIIDQPIWGFWWD
jgi:hypothetical protein